MAPTVRRPQNPTRSIRRWLKVEHGGAPRWSLLVAFAVLAIFAVAVGNHQTGMRNASAVSAVNAIPAPSQTLTLTPKPVAVFIGDATTAGLAATGAGKSFASQIAISENWSERNLSRGGTGYVTSVSDDAQSACGLDYCPNYDEMIPDVVTNQADIVFVTGGRLEVDVDSDDLDEGIAKFYKDLRAALPNAKIYATSPVWDSGKPPKAIDDISASVQKAVSEVGGTFLYLGQPLQQRSDLISADGAHPNDAGQAAIAQAIRTAMGKIQDR